MPDLDLLTEIHTDVKYIKEKLTSHIADDEKAQAREQSIKEKVLYPLWEAHQQRKGAAKLAGMLYTIVGGAIVGTIDFLTKGHP